MTTAHDLAEHPTDQQAEHPAEHPAQQHGVHPAQEHGEHPVLHVLEVVRWTDPTGTTHGHDPRSLYVERFWLGLLGPSATFLMRRLARGLEEQPGGFRLNLSDTGRALGLGESVARNSTTQRTLSRICQFKLATRLTERRIAVRTQLPTLTRRQLERLPESQRAAHAAWANCPPHSEEYQQALAWAVGLRALGEPMGNVEAQLRRWELRPQLIDDVIGAVLTR